MAGQSGKDLGDAEGGHRLQAEKELRSAVAQLGDDVEAEIDAVVGDPAEVARRALAGHRPARLRLARIRARPDVLLGSVRRWIVREVHCPVTVLPRRVKASLEELLSEAPAAAAPA